MKRPVANAAGMDASPTGTACDTHVPIKIQTVTRGRCCRVCPIISCRFATATMSDAARRLLLFATVCYGLRICCRRSRTESTAEPSLIAYIAAKDPGGRRTRDRVQDGRRRPGSSQAECCGRDADRTRQRSE